MDAPEARSKALNAHMSSGFAPRADIVTACRHVRFVPQSCMARGVFEYLGGAKQECLGHCEANRRGCLYMDDQFLFGRLGHGQVSRFRALENFVDVDSGASTQIKELWAVTGRSDA